MGGGADCITQEMMPKLEIIAETKKVVGISDTNCTNKNGHWHVLVTEDSVKGIHKHFTAKIMAWAGALPSNLRANTPPGYPKTKCTRKRIINAMPILALGKHCTCRPVPRAMDHLTTQSQMNSILTPQAARMPQPSPATTLPPHSTPKLLSQPGPLCFYLRIAAKRQFLAISTPTNQYI
jgi:hypothetical protein